MQTKKVEHKWFELGLALGIPIAKLEKITDNHYESPVKALIRVYRYWLAEKNGLMPTWKSLVNALQKIDEYILSTSISNMMICVCNYNNYIHICILYMHIVIKYSST